MPSEPKIVDFKHEKKQRAGFKKGKYLEYKVDFTKFYKLLAKSNGNAQIDHKETKKS